MHRKALQLFRDRELGRLIDVGMPFSVFSVLCNIQALPIQKIKEKGQFGEPI